MGKVVQVSFGNFYYNKLSKPIRNKKDVIELILDTLNVLELKDYNKEVKGDMLIKIDKMSRVFYFLNDKYFSVVFPFVLEEKTEGCYEIYDNILDVEINSKRISLMKNIVDRMDFFQISVEDILEQTYFELFDEGYEEEDINVCWNIIMRLLMMEIGYIRYDYDVIHQNGDLHPLNHLDINFSSKATYKLGLQDRLGQEEFKDLLDIQTRCRYIM